MLTTSLLHHTKSFWDYTCHLETVKRNLSCCRMNVCHPIIIESLHKNRIDECTTNAAYNQEEPTLIAIHLLFSFITWIWMVKFKFTLSNSIALAQLKWPLNAKPLSSYSALFAKTCGLLKRVPRWLTKDLLSTSLHNQLTTSLSMFNSL